MIKKLNTLTESHLGGPNGRRGVFSVLIIIYTDKREEDIKMLQNRIIVLQTGLVIN